MKRLGSNSSAAAAGCAQPWKLLHLRHMHGCCAAASLQYKHRATGMSHIVPGIMQFVIGIYVQVPLLCATDVRQEVVMITRDWLIQRWQQEHVMHRWRLQNESAQTDLLLPINI
jgi:hypothetical protein